MIVLLLGLLLAFGILGNLKQKVTRREVTPRLGKNVSEAPVGPGESVMEEPVEPIKNPPEEAKPVIESLSHSGWVNNGAYEVFGEAQNNGNRVARQVKANVLFKNGSWEKVGEASAFVNSPTLAPGQKTAFKVVFRTREPDKIGSYVILFSVVR